MRNKTTQAHLPCFSPVPHPNTKVKLTYILYWHINTCVWETSSAKQLKHTQGFALQNISVCHPKIVQSVPIALSLDLMNHFHHCSTTATANIPLHTKCWILTDCQKKSYNNLWSDHLLHVVCTSELHIFKCFSPKGITHRQEHYIQHLPYYFIFTLTSNLLGCKTDTVLHKLRRLFSSREDLTSGSITENTISSKK